MYLGLFLSLQVSVDSLDLDTIKLELETEPKSDELENNGNIDQSPISTTDTDPNNEKKHGLVCQIRGKLGLKSKLTPVVPFMKPENFIEEKEENRKNGLVKKLMALKNKVSSTNVKEFVAQKEENKKKGHFGKLFIRARNGLHNLIRKIKK